jgi:hypothetical protein
MKMDWSKFKKVSSDGNSTILKHPRGHQITIAHNALSSKLRKELNDLPQHLAEGGEVEGVSEEAKKSGRKFGISEEKLKEIRRFDAPPEQRSLSSVVDGISNFTNDLSNKASSYFSPAVNSANAVANAESSRQFAHTPAMQEEPLMQVAQAPEVRAPQSVPQQALMPSGGPGESMYMRGLGEAERGIQMEAKAAAELGQQEALSAEQQVANMQALLAGQEKAVATGMADYEKFKNDYMSGKVDQKRYWNSLSGGKRVMTAIGLILGGMGSGLLRQENPAMKLLQDNIERDINAQKLEMGKSENLMSASLRAMGNMSDATRLATALQMNIYSAKLQQAAAKAKDPAAQARALQEAGKLHMEGAKVVQELYQKRYQTQLLNQSGNNPVLAIQLKVPEKLRDDAMKELYAHREIAQNLALVGPTLREAFKNSTVAENYLKNPIQSRQRLAAAKGQLFPIVKSIVGEKMTDADVAAMVDPLIPGLFTNEKTLENSIRKLEQQLTSKAAGRVPILSEYGIVQPLQGTPEYKTMGGVRYMKVPGGWKKAQ